MGYKDALVAAGADILDFATFGDYQGSWYAKVIYKGETLLITGAYGSCSGCDAFEAEFGYGELETWDEDLCKYVPAPDAQEKLARFGEEYLTAPQPFEVEYKGVLERLEWDYEAQQAKIWLEAHFPQEVAEYLATHEPHARSICIRKNSQCT